MATHAIKLLTASLTVVAFTTGAQAGSGFSAENAVSDGQMAELRARTNFSDNQGGTCTGSADCIVGDSFDGDKVSGDNVKGDKIEGDKKKAGENLTVIDGDPMFTNTLDNDAMSGVEGVGTAIQNNGSNATITVNTSVDVTSGPPLQ